MANLKSIAQISIKCRIYQGDTVSPLLSCIGLDPFCQIINKTGYEFHWPKKEIKATDIKKRKLLTMQGGFHSKSSMLRLCAKQKEGG